MIKQIGTKVYYDLLTGNVIQIIGDSQGYVIETTILQDYLTYEKLFEKTLESIGLLEFEYGEYHKLSKDSTRVMVNLETKELIFTHDEIPVIPHEPTELEKIKSRITTLEEENKNIKKALKAVLSGDMQSLAYILYPNDFKNKMTVIPEL